MVAELCTFVLPYTKEASIYKKYTLGVRVVRVIHMSKRAALLSGEISLLQENSFGSGGIYLFIRWYEFMAIRHTSENIRINIQSDVCELLDKLNDFPGE